MLEWPAASPFLFQITAVADPLPVSPSILTKCLGAKLKPQALKPPLGRSLLQCVGQLEFKLEGIREM